MIAKKLPAVLQQEHGNSLSVERVLRQTLEVLDYATVPERMEDQLLVLMDDLRTMIREIDRD